MPNRVYLCEKPKVASALAQALGVKPGSRKEGYIELANGDEVTFLYGHLIEYVPPDYYLAEGQKGFFNPAGLPILPEDKDWVKVPTPELDRKTGRPQLKDGKPFANRQIQIVVDRLRAAKIIVQCGDVDREGQLIADETIQFAGFDPSGTPEKPVERLPIVALDKKSLQKLLAKPRQSNGDPFYYNLRVAGEERSKADWLMGMNLSRAYSCALSKQAGKGGLVVHFGRIRTPTVQLVLQRDLEIERFQPVSFFVPKIDLSATIQLRWTRRLQGFPSTGINPQGLIISSDEAKRVLNRAMNSGIQITKNEGSNVRKKAPLPFNLSTLQSEASSKFGLTAKEVSKIAQSLYEEKQLITYVGTDSRHLPTEQYPESIEVLKAVLTMPTLAPFTSHLNPSLKSECWDDSKVSAHHAIIPTFESPNGKDLSPQQQQIYEFIARRYLSQFMPEYEYQRLVLEGTVTESGDVFANTFLQTKSPGWHLTEGTRPAEGALPGKEEDSDD